jgi:hypothetical protein
MMKNEAEIKSGSRNEFRELALALALLALLILSVL